MQSGAVYSISAPRAEGLGGIHQRGEGGQPGANLGVQRAELAAFLRHFLWLETRARHFIAYVFPVPPELLCLLRFSLGFPYPSF